MKIAVMFALFVGGVSSVQAEDMLDQNTSRTCAVAYQYEGFQGASVRIENLSYAKNLSENAFNNRISSVDVKPGCTLTLFQYYNHEGHSVSLVGGRPGYGNPHGRAYASLGAFNNLASSLICTCSYYRP